MRQPGWWETAVFYEIYPWSFMDADGDGTGDIEGIRQRLDYLDWLGVDAIWITPIYRSPMADCGYDVANHKEIDPLFGSIEDLDRLVAEAHRREIKVILDFVPNHTSDRHPWFLESRSSRDIPKRDWYIWRDPKPDGGPPNNWLSNFGGSAWEWDEATGQYYYHAFLRNSRTSTGATREVRREMLDILRFWLDRGIDGFRVDMIYHLAKHPELRDNPPNPDFRDGGHPKTPTLQTHSADQPDVHDIIAEMRGVLERYDHRVLIGEAYLPSERLMAYYGAGAGVHLPFNFQLIGAPWQARHIADLIERYEGLLPEGAWPNWVLSNHDKPRDRLSHWPSAGAGRGDAAADPPRHADALLRRRARDGGRARCRRSGCRTRPKRALPAGDGTAHARRCSGMRAPPPASPRASPGCPSPTPSPRSTSRPSAGTRTRSFALHRRLIETAPRPFGARARRLSAGSRLGRSPGLCPARRRRCPPHRAEPRREPERSPPAGRLARISTGSLHTHGPGERAGRGRPRPPRRRGCHPREGKALIIPGPNTATNGVCAKEQAPSRFPAAVCPRSSAMLAEGDHCWLAGWAHARKGLPQPGSSRPGRPRHPRSALAAA